MADRSSPAMWCDTAEAHLSHARLWLSLARYADSVAGLAVQAAAYRRAAAERVRAAEAAAREAAR